MTAPVVAVAAQIRPPMVDLILVVVTSGISFPIDITSLRGRFITLQNTGSIPIGWLAGDSTVVADIAAVSGDTRCAVIENGLTDGFSYQHNLTDNSGNLITHIAVISGGASTFRVWQS